jgi:hypothetical protein
MSMQMVWGTWKDVAIVFGIFSEITGLVTASSLLDINLKLKNYFGMSCGY